MMIRSSLVILATLLSNTTAFVAPTPCHTMTASLRMSSDDDVLNKAIEMMGGAGGAPEEAPDVTQARIQSLVDDNPVLLFMKGAKSFPQCGFSDTATKILETFEIDFHTVDVLADSAIREQVKVYSQWPTIPQLYIDGEFIGGSDIMIEMYQNGELKELIETTVKKE